MQACQGVGGGSRNGGCGSILLLSAGRVRLLSIHSCDSRDSVVLFTPPGVEYSLCPSGRGILSPPRLSVVESLQTKYCAAPPGVFS